jgi:[ribosomal protein S18]-alanine N-acetyltransferase
MKVRELTDADALDIKSWRYDGKYATYDVAGGVSPGLGYFAVEHGGRLVGYCCFGAEARVPGVGEEPGTLDVGYGMRPELMGQGLGRSFVSTIVGFGVRRFDPVRLRMLILRWNDRSRRAAERQGFAIVGARGDFDVLERDPKGHRGNSVPAPG